MDSFYTIVVSIAFVILVLVLIAVGIMMQKQDEDKEFPAYASKCPDGWTYENVTHGDTEKPACKHHKNNQKIFDDNTNNHYGTKYAHIITDVSGIDHAEFKPTATICEKKKWATDMGVSWDGVTNYNKC